MGESQGYHHTRRKSQNLRSPLIVEMVRSRPPHAELKEAGARSSHRFLRVEREEVDGI